MLIPKAVQDFTLIPKAAQDFTLIPRLCKIVHTFPNHKTS